VFYLSRAEQIALFVLLALLLTGGAVLTYQRGVRAGRSQAVEPFFIDAPPPSAAGAVTGGSGAPEAGPPPAPVESTESHGPPAPVRARSPGQAPPLISLNQATAADLDSLPGIGPVYAKRIVAYREKKKRETGKGFESVDELLNVSGIGPKRLAAVRDRVVP